MLFTAWARLSYFLTDFAFYLLLIILSLIVLPFSSYKIYKSGLSQNRKKLLISLLFTVFSLILALCAFEAYFRYQYDESDGLGFLKVNQRWHARHVVFNSDFMRDRNFENKKDGTARICALGDSITFGGGIKRVEDRFSNLLQKKLRDSGRSVEVYNLGRSGYDTEAEIRVYKETEFLKCDIIVWEYFLNDIQPEDTTTGAPIIARASQTAKVISFFSNYSYFFDYLYWKLSARYEKTFQQLGTADLDRYQEEQTLQRHEKIITAFLNDLKSDREKVVVIIFPFVNLLPDYPAAGAHQLMAEVFKSGGAEVIDLLDDLKNQKSRDLIASKFDFHPNEYVHQLAAEKLFEKVAPLIK
ncbi:SGNH/GDSL hydrolase family protein [Candidatus Curtissbacteria bacterium]|nr:SGNH/GDSL hydrolase family protein [Candidatus Curtissbacteria bacterium]